MSGREFCRGGKRGGSRGPGLGALVKAARGGGGGEATFLEGGGGGVGEAPSNLRTGGFGRFAVDKPVVSTR